MSDMLEELDQHLEPEDASPEEPPSEEPQVEAAPEEQPEPEEPAEEAPAEEEPVEQPQARDERLQSYLDKYGGDVDKALAAAVDAQELIGRQGSELGDLRQTLDRLNENLERPEEAQLGPETVDWLDQLVDTNPAAAALWARENDPSGMLFNRVLEAWYEIPGEGPKATSFQIAIAQQEQEKRFQASQQPLQKQAEQQEIWSAWTQARGQVPDLDQYADAIVQEAKDSPEILRAATTPEEKRLAIVKLYKLARGTQASTLEAAKTETELERKTQSREAKLGAKGVSQSQVPRETEEPDEQDAWAEELLGPYLEPAPE